jgi:cobalt-zinc-cadmium efflux system membrane fusion protein
VADTVNPETRTISVRSQDKTPTGSSSRHAGHHADPGRARRAVVPPRRWWTRRCRTFVEVAKGQFRLTPRSGPDGRGRAVLSGLKPEQPILVEGAFHLNNERKRKELE